MRSRRVHVTGSGRETRLRLTGNWDNDPIGSLSDTARLSTAVEKLQYELIAKARENGCSWTEIGHALSISRQAAWERFSREE